MTALIFLFLILIFFTCLISINTFSDFCYIFLHNLCSSFFKSKQTYLTVTMNLWHWNTSHTSHSKYDASVSWFIWYLILFMCVCV